MYTLGGEGLLFKVDKIVLNLIMMCNDELYVSAAKFMTYRKGLRVTIKFFQRVGGG